jgi:predicted nucleic acid-binding protein
VTAKIFVDTNVLLDVLAEREPFCGDSQRIWTMSETERVEGLVSAMSFSNCYYIVRKYAGKRSADKAVKLLRDVFSPVDLTAQVLNQAMDSEFADFEDAIQFYSATHAKAGFIITRNADHFPRTSMPVLSPTEFLAMKAIE